MDTNTSTNISLAEEIKALLILLLLKGGTPASDIEVALRIASGQGAFRSQSDAELFPAADEKPAPAPAPPQHEAAPQIQAAAKSFDTTPKQTVRNDYLAPIKAYAA